MAETQDAEGSNSVIVVEEEIEGNHIGTRNYRFRKIGESAPIKPDAESEYDMNSLPARPLAVSDRLGVIFLAHSTGFCVARITDVMNLAEELKNGGNGSSIQEQSVVDVPIGKVSILALSAGSSTLAVCVGSVLHFFSVDGLLNKNQEPSFSKLFDDSSCIKDMKWSTNLEKHYVVLMADGNLYSGDGQGGFNEIMDNVDAVDWSMDGKFVAVAKDNYLSILSSKFKEHLRIMLSFKSWVGDSDENCVAKVDSVSWVRPDCIILGCYQLKAGTEENYLVQAVTVKDGKITNASSNPIALSFSDMFLALNDDAIPFGSGPYMFLSYLDERELAFVANRKNTDQHIALLSWSSDEKNEAAMIEILKDGWLPRIDNQGNDEDNLIFGLAINKVSHDEKVKLMVGEEDTEVSPCCILLCLTVDGKLFMFHFASATGSSILPEEVNCVSEEEDNSPPLSSKHGLLNISYDKKQIGGQVNEPSGKAGFATHMSNKNEQAKSTAFSQLSKRDEEVDVPVARLDNDSVERESPSSQKQDGKLVEMQLNTSQPVNPSAMLKDSKTYENKELDEVRSIAGSVSAFPTDKSDKTLFGAPLKDFRVSAESSGNLASTGLHGSSGSFLDRTVFSTKTFDVQPFALPHASVQGSTTGSLSSGGMFSMKTSDAMSSLLPHAGVQGIRPNTDASTKHVPSGPQKFSFDKMTSGSASRNLLGHGASGVGFTNLSPVVPNAQPSLGKSSDFKGQSDKGSHRTHTQSRLLKFESNLSEQHSVEEMAKELDALLDSIQRPGGFYDASVALHKASVTALEDGMWALSDRCQKWKGTMDHGLEEIQLLLDKTVQVLARKLYVEAIVKQATDSQYRDIWNRQKLNSELEMKRRHILELNQNLTNQLIELERHLNTLELQRFGDNGDVQMSRRSFQMKHGPSRQIQSLHSLHNTMNAQLSAAEKLSECLSKQMAVLSIDTEPVKKQNVKKELFEAIGISYDGSTFSPPREEKTTDILSKNKLSMSSSSTAAKAHTKTSQRSVVKSSEPETARRCRDSLDRNWASFEPPKTTVKRMLLHEERQMSPERLSLQPGTQNFYHRLLEGSAVSRDIPGPRDTQIKRRSEGQSNSSLSATYHSDSSKTHGSVAPTLGFDSKSTPSISQNTSRDLHDPTAERSRNRLTFTLKSDSIVGDDSKSSQKSQSFLEQPSSNNTNRSPAHKNIFEKKLMQFSESSVTDTLTSKSTIGDGSHRPLESSPFLFRKSQESPLSTVSNSTTPAAFFGKSFTLQASNKESQLGEVSIPSIPPPPLSTPAISQGVSTPSEGTKLGAQKVSQSESSASSFPSFPSTTSFGAFEEPVASSSVTPSATIELNISKSEMSKLNSKASENSTPQVVSVPSSKPDEKSSAQNSPSTVSSSEARNNLSATNNPASVVSNSKPEQPSVAPALSSSAPSSGKNDNSDVAFTQEDEMEEEAPDTTQLTMGNLGGFGLGSAPNPSAPKQNPFGAPFSNTGGNTPVTSFTMTAPSSGLFRPASFNIQSPQSPQPSQQTNFGAFSGGFNTSQSNAGQGFGQPAQIGSGQQALGSVLGSFGQSRQLGTGMPGSVASPTPFGGGFGGNQAAGGFAAASGGGFANLASGGGGFGALATSGGGFAAAATGGGGFAAAATGGGGFAAAATAGGGFSAPAANVGGFGGAASGGFGGFSSQGGSAFSSFGSTGGTARPPSQLFTQMRK